MTAMKWQVTTIDIIRHGKPEGGEIFRGHIDVPLSEEGFAQMEEGVAKLKTHSAMENWDLVVSSPLIRCAEFASRVAQRDGLALVTDEGFKEISFGDWDGKAFVDVKKDYGEQFDNYWRDPVTNTPPNAEPLTDFADRVDQALSRVIADNRGKKILLITHGGVIRAILNQILAAAMDSFLRFEVPYASASRIHVYHDEGQDFPQLDFHNR
ncbi:Putative phosphoserine phosphatase 2 [BD1-7 clade bacterium]|uniref:Phosphoserine phosphatase 2 n=1 Tax=BD1-7 clade bacterium TaxID=2029982 RepID=A0A5S9QBN0_9GAMM|nr:Putative phosphoserine phosphatase 2 [BD1-7 clade bacterium]CAA0115634.1 Putative phosphoserine phosphatase 2 [BD1-7 clade bacterium]